MGAWGFKVFENDDALDWANELKGTADDTPLREAFSAVIDESDYLEAPPAAEALAAAEVVAAMRGDAVSELPDEAREYVSRVEFAVDDFLSQQARQAVEKVREDSELRELWEESEYFEQWSRTVEDLRRRL
jgi:hypothetical protein